jgi:hypothetical protein
MADTTGSEADMSLPIDMGSDNSDKSLLQLVMEDPSMRGNMGDWDHLDTDPKDTRPVDADGFRMEDDEGNPIDQFGNPVDEKSEEPEAKEQPKQPEVKEPEVQEEPAPEGDKIDPQIVDQWKFLRSS